VTCSKESGIVLVKVTIDFLSSFYRELQDKFLFAKNEKNQTKPTKQIKNCVLIQISVS
jgi:hypothetical protein